MVYDVYAYQDKVSYHFSSESKKIEEKRQVKIISIGTVNVTRWVKKHDIIVFCDAYRVVKYVIYFDKYLNKNNGLIIDAWLEDDVNLESMKKAELEMSLWKQKRNPVLRIFDIIFGKE